ncbi:MAG TPA: glucose-6-phosphate dehydrogenase, partial [Actinobacteria bacterium]|nr:glucose-6-phosphate dehydrogenase [Actinomycetota bacterium]
MSKPVATDLVIFGASGDLAKRKIIPALQSLNGDGGRLRVLGAGRSDMSREQFQAIVAQATNSPELAAGAEWVKLDYDAPASYAELRRLVGEGNSVVYYLATPPKTFAGILDALSEAGLAGRDLPGEHRIVVEKPLGQDAPSARRLNEQLKDLFNEDQVF